MINQELTCVEASLGKYKKSVEQFTQSLSRYITTIIELVDAGCNREIIIEHLRNVQKVLHDISVEKDA